MHSCHRVFSPKPHVPTDDIWVGYFLASPAFRGRWGSLDMVKAPHMERKLILVGERQLTKL